MEPSVKSRFRLGAMEQAIITCVDAYEQADVSTRHDLSGFVEKIPQEFQRAALIELIRVDFERRWISGDRRSVARYLDEYPDIRAAEDSVLDLLQAEYGIRELEGQKPTIDEYRQILPGFTPPSNTTRVSGKASDVAPASGKSLAPEPRVAPKQPKQLKQYKIVRKLGSGGFGVVYQGFDQRLERNVAIKIRRRGANEPGLSGDLLNEAKSIARLDHPGIVRLIEVGEAEEGAGYVVYEFVDGQTLEERIKSKDFDRDQAAEWVAQIAEALHYAHKQSIVHRDIKPANILIDRAGRSKIVDFGLARRDDSFYLDDVNRVLGTLSYLSPEQADRKAHWASPQSDIYSLGVVLYELLCGKRPFKSSDAMELLEQVKRRPPTPPRSIDDSIPKPLEDVCLKALSKEADARYRTGDEMAQAIRAAVRPSPSAGLSIARRGAMFAGLAAACILAVGLWQHFMASPAATPTVSSVPAPEFKLFKLWWTRGEEDRRLLISKHLPLRGGDHLQVEARLNRQAYTYLLFFDQDGKSQLLWPSAEKLDDQKQDSLVSYPRQTDSTGEFVAPNADGASLIIALASQKPLDRQSIDKLLATRLSLGVTQEQAANYKTLAGLAQPASAAPEDWLLRGDVELKSPDFIISDDFKKLLGECSDSHCGLFVPYKKNP